MMRFTTMPVLSCMHCGAVHRGPCPRIAAVDYYPDGTVKRIEYQKDEPRSGFHPVSDKPVRLG